MNTEPRIIPVGQELPPIEPRQPRPGLPAQNQPKRPVRIAGGRFGVLNRFVDLTLRRIGPTPAAVWLVLFRDTKPDGTARTGQEDIAKRIGKSVRTVYDALRRLEKLGLLIVVRRGRVNTGPTVYRVRPLTKEDF